MPDSIYLRLFSPLTLQHFVCLACLQIGHIANKAFWKNSDGDQPPDFTELHFQDEKIMDKDGKIWMPSDDKMKVTPIAI